jgi:hypothetical protein
MGAAGGMAIGDSAGSTYDSRTTVSPPHQSVGIDVAERPRVSSAETSGRSAGDA